MRPHDEVHKTAKNGTFFQRGFTTLENRAKTPENEDFNSSNWSAIWQIVPSTRQIVPSTWHFVPSTRQFVPSTRQVVPSTRQVVPSTPRVVCSICRGVSETRQVVPATRRVVGMTSRVVLTIHGVETVLRAEITRRYGFGIFASSSAERVWAWFFCSAVICLSSASRCVAASFLPLAAARLNHA